MKNLLLMTVFIAFQMQIVNAQSTKTKIAYSIAIPQPASHKYQVTLQCSNWNKDSIQLKLPKWMPGYYQIMNYAQNVENMMAKDDKGKNLAIKQLNENTWSITGIKNKPFNVFYSIKTEKQFVANSYVDSAHAYLIPANSFLYIPGLLNIPVSVNLQYPKNWKKVATGLDPVQNKSTEFTAANFDILYDCPILIGDLQELPSFKVQGIEHRFIGYKMGDFNHSIFMSQLKKVVESAVATIGHVPFKQYTFIGIGPGRGGIEHLNNTTISFDGKGLDKPEAMNRMMNFIAHEYFHHYNVKRIRPYELGPFDYDKGNRTNLLWVSEGISVYYEYLIVKRAGLADATTLFNNFNRNITATENNPGRLFQSLQQASYSTWSDGPFGTQGTEPGKSISYYDKGPIIGMLLDFAIRNATQNHHSLNDVMQLLYWKYYMEQQRGFTEAEFQSACEQIAGIPLSPFFEYVYTTKEIDYNKYLAYAGLQLNKQLIESKEKGTTSKYQITMINNPSALQTTILKSWLGE